MVLPTIRVAVVAAAVAAAVLAMVPLLLLFLPCVPGVVDARCTCRAAC